jgi:NTP pyrophosphatase (non-canonical NTP hydrolase)
MDKTPTFTELALRTESRPEALQNLSKQAVLELLGVIATAGAAIDTAKRAIFYGKPLDSAKIRGELDLLSAQSTDLSRLIEDGESSITGDQFNQPNLRLLHATLGIFGEAGELAEALIKEMNTGELDLVNVSEELGDVDWYKQIGHDETGVGEADVRAKIIAKLQKRYPDKFDADAALNRDLPAEREALETTTA